MVKRLDPNTSDNKVKFGPNQYVDLGQRIMPAQGYVWTVDSKGMPRVAKIDEKHR